MPFVDLFDELDGLGPCSCTDEKNPEIYYQGEKVILTLEDKRTLEGIIESMDRVKQTIRISSREYLLSDLKTGVTIKIDRDENPCLEVRR